ncbi:triple tyrosine motif-containing protein [Oscillospiraceae bacterium LCP25S3_E10]|nr:starch-binding protein [Ruminococcus sp.]MDD6446569.1 triple tyrosine motif-containing protein [Ruminococcus sp.]MDY2857258.1 triple tyrosine motif-containing protein [Oscillospiraceae bacterium]
MTKKRTSRMAVCLLSLVLIVTSMCCLGTAAASAAGTYGTTIYLQTDDTTDPYLHYWVNGNTSQSSTWPGVKMTKVTGETNVYSYKLPCDVGSLSGVIFNNGGGGNKMTGDVTNITGNLYKLSGSSGSWSMYDTSALKLSVETDVEAPQYKGTDIVIKAVSAGGQGTVTYTFSVNSQTIYTGTNSTCTWTPTQAGTYTIKVDAKDTAGNTNSKQISYEIKDDAQAVEPVLKGISTGYSGQVPVNTSIPVNVKASGGNVGTNLLFYKVAVTDPNGNAVNTVYYKQSNILNFTPTQKGDYKVDVTVQNSKNTTTQKAYTVTVGDGASSVAPEISSFYTGSVQGKVGTAVVLGTVVSDGTGTPSFTYTYSANGKTVAEKTSSSRSNTVSWTPTQPGNYTLQVTVKDSKNLTATQYVYNFVVVDGDTEAPTETPTEAPTESPTGGQYTKGDVTGDGKVSLADVVYVMRSVMGYDGYKLTAGTSRFDAADMDNNGKINVIDAVLIARTLI